MPDRQVRLIALRDATGLAGLHLFALSAFLSTAGANIGLGLMLVSMLADGRNAFKALHAELTARLGLAVIVMSLVLTGVGMVRAPDAWAASQWDAAVDLGQLGFFLLPAWWLARRPQGLPVALGLALAGFLLGRLLAIDWGQPLAVRYARDGLGYPAIAFGSYSAAVLLGSLAMMPRIWRAAPPVAARAIAMGLLVALMVVAVQGVVWSRSRGVWLALLFVAFVLAAIWLWRRWGSGHPARLVLIVLGGALAPVALAACAYLLNPDLVGQRLSQEHQAIRALLAADLGAVGQDSIGTRVHMAVAAVGYWWERPLLGWGAGASPFLLDVAGAHLSQYQDLHSAYLEILVAFGLVGVLISAALIFSLGRNLVQAWRAKRVGHDYLLLIGGALALHLLAALSNYRMENTDWRFFWFLFAGAAFATALQSRPSYLSLHRRSSTAVLE